MNKTLKSISVATIVALAVTLSANVASAAPTYSKIAISKVVTYEFPAAPLAKVTQLFDVYLDNAKAAAPQVKNVRANSVYYIGSVLSVTPVVGRTYVTDALCPKASTFKGKAVCKQIATDVTVTVSGGFIPALLLAALKLVGIDSSGVATGRVITFVDPKGTTFTSWIAN